RMTFPEATDRPSRTVMATMSASTREAIIFEAKDSREKHIGYRMPTIREIATFMSFPITYQFESGSEGGKYKLVGNAVCCRQAAAIAEAIILDEGFNPPKSFVPLPDVRPSKDLTGMIRGSKKEGHKKPDAKFWMHVPHIKFNSIRAHISNMESDFKSGGIRWKSEIRYGPAKGHKVAAVDNISLERFMETGEKSTLTLKGKFKKFKSKVNRTFDGKLPDAETFQKMFCERKKRGNTPENVLEKIKEIVDKHYPEKRFQETMLDNSSRTISIDKDKIPIRVLAAAYGCNFVVEQLMGQLRYGKSFKHTASPSSS
ncbi:hypothetical protein FJZ53_06970, partial [Candidatus Woesearchaeota archaeon]|nr:hypothetical protein [Candidatus Woesearchaeota archaeon]